MKKLFAFLMFAATMMVGCNNGNEPEPKPEPNPNDKFYGMTLNEAEVLNRGDYYNDGTNSYIVYMYKVENGEAARVFVGEIITPEVNDGVIPAGKYTIEDGSMAEGDFDKVLEGSLYVRNTEDGYIMLVTGGYFEVKHLENGDYQLTASFSGVDFTTGEAVTPAEGRFEGKPTMLGLPASNNYEVFAPAGCQAVYEPYDGYAVWEVMLYDSNLVSDKYPAHLSDIVLLTEDLGEKTLPQGTFPIDYYGTMELGTVYGYVNVSYNSAEDEGTADAARDGYVTIKALGEGKYSVEVVAFGENGAYKQSYSGAVQFFSNAGTTYNFDVAQASFGGEYNGNTWWVLFLGDSTADRLFWIYVNTPADCNASTGIPSGNYVVADTSEPGTIDVGFIDGDGYVNGTMVTDLAQKSVYAYVTGGNMLLVNNGDGTYSIEVDMKDHNKKGLYGSYSGAVNVVDGTGGSGGGGGETPEPSDATELNIEAAGAYYLGAGEGYTVWEMDLVDNTITKDGLVIMLQLLLGPEATYANGIPSGTYPVSADYDLNSVVQGYATTQGVGGSLFLTGDMKYYYDVVYDGWLAVENKGDNQYDVEFLLAPPAGSQGMIPVCGTYAGEWDSADASQAPAKVIGNQKTQLKKMGGMEKEASNLRLSPLARTNNFAGGILNF